MRNVSCVPMDSRRACSSPLTRIYSVTFPAPPLWPFALGIVASLGTEFMGLKELFKGALCNAVLTPKLVRVQVAVLYPPIYRPAGNLQPLGYLGQRRVTLVHFEHLTHLRVCSCSC